MAQNVQYFTCDILHDQGRAVGFEKGGPDLVGDPPKKIITRPDPPKKSKSPQFWATSKWKFLNFQKKNLKFKKIFLPLHLI